MENGQLLESFKQEALGDSIAWFPHDTNSLQDDRLWSYFEEVGHDGLSKYWLLAEALHRKRGNHSFRIGDMRLAQAMYTSQEDCDGIVEAMHRHGLLDAHLYEDGIVTIARVQRNIEEYAEGKARRKLGATKTNRKKQER